MQSLTIGPVHTLVQDTVYALPSRLCLYTVDTSETVEVSLNGTDWMEVTLGDNFNFLTAAKFIRAIDADALIVAAPYTSGL